MREGQKCSGGKCRSANNGTKMLENAVVDLSETAGLENVRKASMDSQNLN